MSLNIIDLVKNQMGGDLFGKLGSLIGETPDKTKAAAGAAVPALLAGISSVASKPEGANALMSALGQQDSDQLGNFSNLLGSQGDAIAQQGSGLLGKLLGGNMLSNLTGVLGRFTGLGQGSTGNLLGALAPMVLGVLGKQSKSMGLDAGGLANMLAGQKQNIVGAMPSGLGPLLGSVPGIGSLFGSLQGAVSSTANAVSNTAASAARAGVASMADTTRRTGSSALRWAVPLILVVGAFFLMRSFRRAEPAATSLTDPSAPAASVAMSDAARITENFQSIFTKATETLGGIRDAASAEAAAPKLREINSQLDGLKGLWTSLPDSVKPTVSSAVNSSMGGLNEVLQKVMAIPGVGEKLRPLAEEMLTKLKGFAP